MKEVKTKRIDGYLHRIIQIEGDQNKINYTLQPIGWEFKPRDFFQILMGAAILAIPLAFTGEVWDLGKDLSMTRVVWIGITTITILGLYVYFNMYRFHLRNYIPHFLIRICLIYLGSLTVVTIILLLIDKAPFLTAPQIAIKRIVIIGFASSMSATVTDSLK
ncbi:DUF2391 family protein [Spirochaeta cellobiosiphila]|uniref:DUF2391 family protein n=1 Tax=Spirochaeta cellobiosiphila TaxID=504483 RepID=UPI00041B47EB|nr:DUF2391 family protein [Spirochaeta cellobiosiphila]